MPLKIAKSELERRAKNRLVDRSSKAFKVLGGVSAGVGISAGMVGKTSTKDLAKYAKEMAGLKRTVTKQTQAQLIKKVKAGIGKYSPKGVGLAKKAVGVDKKKYSKFAQALFKKNYIKGQAKIAAKYLIKKPSKKTLLIGAGIAATYYVASEVAKYLDKKIIKDKHDKILKEEGTKLVIGGAAVAGGALIANKLMSGGKKKANFAAMKKQGMAAYKSGKKGNWRTVNGRKIFFEG